MCNFSISFIRHRLEQPVKSSIARWFKLPPSRMKDPFFLSRHFRGVNVPSPAKLFKQRQAHMLKYPHLSDPAAAGFYEVAATQRGLDSSRSTSMSRRDQTGRLLLQTPSSMRRPTACASLAGFANDRARWSHDGRTMIALRGVPAIDLHYHAVPGLVVRHRDICVIELTVPLDDNVRDVAGRNHNQIRS